MTESVLIGDFLRRIKRPIELDAKKHYKLVTIKMKHKGVVLRHEKIGDDIKSKMYEVKTGDFILSGIDARNGAFGIVPKELNGAIVTNDFWYFEIDENVVDKYLFLELTSTQWFDEICRKGSDGTTQRIRLQKNKFFNQKINLPPINEQGEFISWFKQCKQKNNALSDEINRQQTLLKKLRQSILQEAIEGKLTADWRQQNPDVGPASELLARIKAEKEQLIKDNKTKKQKPLPPITEEKPFDLPEGWEWVRLDDCCTFINGKAHEQLIDKNGKYILINSKYISMNGAVIKRTNQCNCPLNVNDVVIVMSDVPNGKALARCFLVDAEDTYTLNQRIGALRPIELHSLYFKIMLERNSHFLNFDDGNKQTNLRKGQILSCPLGIPPLSEQKAIVTKVTKLLALCDQLETQITNNQTHAEQLMQAVLKEAFSQNSKHTEKARAKATKAAPKPMKKTRAGSC